MTEKEAQGWTKVEGSLAGFSRKQLHKLMKLCRRELNARWQFDEALKEWKLEGFRGLANFMAGVTWAVACRAALRESKGHTPVGGKRAQSGEMWLPRELLTAVRHQVKDRGWHPITAPSAEAVLNELAAEDRARQPLPADYAERFNAVRFVIPFSKTEAITVLDLDDRFDKSGAV